MYKIYNELIEQLSPEIKEILNVYEKKIKGHPELEQEFLDLYPIVVKTQPNDTTIRYNISLNEMNLVFNRFYVLFTINERVDNNYLYVTTIKDSKIKIVFYEKDLNDEVINSATFMSNFYNRNDVENNKVDMIIDLVHNNNDSKINTKDIIDTLELVCDINSEIPKHILEKIVEHQVKIKIFLKMKNKKLINKIGIHEATRITQ